MFKYYKDSHLNCFFCSKYNNCYVINKVFDCFNIDETISHDEELKARLISNRNKIINFKERKNTL